MTELSYSRGPDDPLLEKTISEVLSEMAGRLPNHEALVVRHQDERLSYRKLKERVEAVACGLTGLGLKPDDRIGVWASGCLEWVLLFLACARSGLVQVNVNPAYRSQDLGFVIRKSKIKTLFLHARDARADYRQILDETIAGQELPLKHAIYLGEDSWDKMLANGREVPDVAVKPHDVFNIQYTSGTTGSPKGVLLTHHNLVNNAWVLSQWMNFTESDRLCNCFPLYHCAGCVLGLPACLVSGTTFILSAPQFDAGKALGNHRGRGSHYPFGFADNVHRTVRPSGI